MEWLFEGFGTAIITFILGLGAGGAVGYRIGIKKKKVVQKQRAKDNASQIQIGGDYNGK